MASIIKILFLENKRDLFSRTPEPHLVMGPDSQAISYHDQSAWGGDMDPLHLLHLSHFFQLVRDGDQVVDLACGTGDLLIKVARCFPKSNFIGVDLSDEMLGEAQKTCERLQLKNIRFIKNDITMVEALPDNFADVVTSTMALHHLPDEKCLLDVAKTVNRILKPGGRIYISDFLLLHSRKTVDYLVANNRNQDDQTFQVDFLNSMLAAFTYEDYEKFSAQIDKTQISLKKSRFLRFMVQLRSITPRRFSNSLRFLRSIPWSQIRPAYRMDFLRLKFLLG